MAVDLNRLRESLKNGRPVTVNSNGVVEPGENPARGTVARPKTFA